VSLQLLAVGDEATLETLDLLDRLNVDYTLIDEVCCSGVLEDVEEVGAEVVLIECNSCVHNLANAKLRKQKFKIYNISQFVNELMEEAE